MYQLFECFGLFLIVTRPRNKTAGRSTL